MTAEAWFLVPAAAVALGVLALAPLGAQVLARGVVFIDLAVAQAAAAAALWAGAWIDHPSLLQSQAAAAAGALGCAAAVVPRQTMGMAGAWLASTPMGRAFASIERRHRRPSRPWQLKWPPCR